jgi:O-antigen/teichoic acid export membrane protein
MSMLARQPNGYSEVAVYNAATQWYGLMLLVPGAVSSAFLPLLASVHGEAGAVSRKKLLINSILLNVALTFPLAAILSALSPFIMLAYGADFMTSWPVLVLSVIAGVIHAAVFPAWQAIVVSERGYFVLAMNLGWALLAVGISWCLIGGGAMGIASGRLVASLLHGALLIATAFVSLQPPQTVETDQKTGLAVPTDGQNKAL